MLLPGRDDLGGKGKSGHNRLAGIAGGGGDGTIGTPTYFGRRSRKRESRTDETCTDAPAVRRKRYYQVHNPSPGSPQRSGGSGRIRGTRRQCLPEPRDDGRNDAVQSVAHDGYILDVQRRCHKPCGAPQGADTGTARRRVVIGA